MADIDRNIAKSRRRPDTMKVMTVCPPDLLHRIAEKTEQLSSLERAHRRRFSRLLKLTRYAFERIRQLEEEIEDLKAQREGFMKALLAAGQEARKQRQTEPASPLVDLWGHPVKRGDA
jgi:DNA repair ATPase RecN